jgi:hypothetical protein
MTAARLKRLARLEARRQPEQPWTDPFEVAFALFQRVQAGERFEPLIGPPTLQVWDAIKQYDRLSERLRAELPG